MNLSSQAQALAERFPKASLSQEALEFLERSAGPWVLGCSGGVDSVCLALLLHALFPEKACVLAHFNHGLRGSASDSDEAFVAELASGLGFECMSECAERTIVGGSDASEAVLRAERFAFFEKVLSEKGGSVLLLAHQADDVAETLLMRLARGSGLTGLCAPRPVHAHGNAQVRVRPLITVTREAIEKAFQELDIRWRVDGSNFSDDYFRNRIRHRVLPALKDAAPTLLLPNMLHARSLLEEDDAALEAWVDALFENISFESSLDVTVLEGKPKALSRRVLYRWLHAHQRSLTRALFEKILRALNCGDSGMWSVGNETLVVFNKGILSLDVAQRLQLDWQPKGMLIAGGSVFFPNGSFLRAELVKLTEGLLARILQGKVNPQKEAYVAPSQTVLHVRSPRPGDRFYAFGAPGSKKLQDCFVDKKVPQEVRRRLPLILCDRGEILWCAGFPPCEKSRLKPGMSYALRLTYDSYGC